MFVFFCTAQNRLKNKQVICDNKGRFKVNPCVFLCTLAKKIMGYINETGNMSILFFYKTDAQVKVFRKWSDPYF